MSRCKKRKLTRDDCQDMERRRTSRILKALDDELDVIKTGIIQQSIRFTTYRSLVVEPATLTTARGELVIPQLDDQQDAIEKVQSKIRKAIEQPSDATETASDQDNLAPVGLISRRQDDLESSIEETVIKEPDNDPFLHLGARPKVFTCSTTAIPSLSERSSPTLEENNFSQHGVVPNTEGHEFNGETLIDVAFTKMKICDYDVATTPDESDHAPENYLDYPEFGCENHQELADDPVLTAVQMEMDNVAAAHLEEKIMNEFPSAQDPSAPDGCTQEKHKEWFDDLQQIAARRANQQPMSDGTVEEPSLAEIDDDYPMCYLSSSESEMEREFQLPEPEEILETDPICDGARGLPLNYATIKMLKRQERALATEEERNEFFYHVFDMAATHTYMQVNQRDIMMDLIRAESDRRNLKGNRTMFKKFVRKHADIKMFYEFRNLETDQIVNFESAKYPRKMFPRDKWEKRSEYAVVSVKSMYEHDRLRHAKKEGYVQSKRVVLFVDGLPTSKSSHEQLTMIAMKILPCKTNYIYGMHLYKKDSGLNVNKIMRKLIDELQENGLSIKRVIADAPMRAKLKGLKQFNGTFSCEVCECVGEIFGRRTVFPASTMDAPERSSMEWFDLAQRIQANGIETFSKAELKGITCCTPLSLLQGFDIIDDFLLEPMHNLSGCAKKLIQLTLGFNASTKSLSIRQTETLSKFDKRWTSIVLPREFNRRPRSIIDEFVNLKSQELVSIVVAGFLAVAEAIDAGIDESDDKFLVATSWMQFAYIFRAVMFDSTKLEKIMQRTDLSNLIRNFYLNYEEAHGQEHCSWNLHTFSHILRTRKLTRLPPISALKFEGDFSFVKKVMKTNTTSFPLQVINKVFRRNGFAHDCDYTVNFNSHSSSRYADNIVYTENSIFYQIVDTKVDDYIAKSYLTTSVMFPTTQRLNWQVVGVEKWDRLEHDVQVVSKRSVIGKGVIDGPYIIAIPFDCLFT